MDRDLSHFIAAIRRVPLFQRLKTDQALILLKASERRSVDARETLCKYGEPSLEMFILLSGELSVRTREGVQIAKIAPIAPMGEMGIFTEEPRSATVTALQPSTLLVLTKAQIDMIMRRNPEIEIAISRNLIEILSERLRNANQEIAHLSRLIADQDAGAKTLEEEDDLTP